MLFQLCVEYCFLLSLRRYSAATEVLLKPFFSASVVAPLQRAQRLVRAQTKKKNAKPTCFISTRTVYN